MQQGHDGTPSNAQPFNMNQVFDALPRKNDPRRDQRFPHSSSRSTPFRPGEDFTYNVSQQPQSSMASHQGTSSLVWGHPHPYLTPSFGERAGNVAPLTDWRLWSITPTYNALASRGYPGRVGTQQTAIPPTPRGPPRKPRRLGYALWVGNLPSNTNIERLKDHFATGAKQTIESVFLISKSNCAFVNYRTGAACSDAMKRFHNGRFGGRALVCRSRNIPPAESPSIASGEALAAAQKSSVPEEITHPLIVGGGESYSSQPLTPSSTNDFGAASKIPAQYFVLKSLTLEDLEASVVTSIWSTQPHVKDVLKKAYREAETVYLIFSANRSGEYFGYARVVSEMCFPTETHQPEIKPEASATNDKANAPQIIVTPETETAPKGYIIDDSARGSIFWEADRSEAALGLQQGESAEEGGGNGFQIEWISTTRISFQQTRGMRNCLNGNKEVKIARDGQEIDPRVGRRLLQLFATSAPQREYSAGVLSG